VNQTGEQNPKQGPDQVLSFLKVVNQAKDSEYCRRHGQKAFRMKTKKQGSTGLGTRKMIAQRGNSRVNQHDQGKRDEDHTSTDLLASAKIPQFLKHQHRPFSVKEREPNKYRDAGAQNQHRQEHGKLETRPPLGSQRVWRLEKRFSPRHGQTGVLVTFEQSQKPGMHRLVSDLLGAVFVDPVRFRTHGTTTMAWRGVVWDGTNTRMASALELGGR